MNWERFLFWRKPDPHIVLDRHEGQSEGDSLVVKHLRNEGVDLSKAREVLHYLYLPSEDVAAEAATELRTDGYNVELRLAANADKNPPNPWLVLAKVEAIVDDHSVEQTTFRFTELASRHGGEYDGWEAAAIP
jgi:Regulator of ribonuclease activity B